MKKNRTNVHYALYFLRFLWYTVFPTFIDVWNGKIRLVHIKSAWFTELEKRQIVNGIRRERDLA